MRRYDAYKYEFYKFCITYYGIYKPPDFIFDFQPAFFKYHQTDGKKELEYGLLLYDMDENQQCPIHDKKIRT